ncbi:MAG: hypothetical protein H6836_05060 [Planctomycetes bacterium]|nr:hypothetical protein [Planctomycetota bacterium]
MDERHDLEQYFFDDPTVAALADFAARFAAPCCVCAPLLGQALVERGAAATILDVDERFGHLPGFLRFDLYRPHWIDRTFDLIVCDPPFFKVKLSQLFDALRLLAHNDFRQPLMVCFLQRRRAAVLATFHRFGLQPTGFEPQYRTVQHGPKNAIEVFTNLPAEHLTTLVTPPDPVG